MKHEDTYDLQHELEQISPLLASLPKNGGTIGPVPSGYFNRLEEDVMSVAAIQSHESTLPPVPQGYFEELEHRILATPGSGQKPKHAGQPRFIYLMWAVAAASVLVLGVIFTIRVVNNQTADPYDSITQEEYIDYLEEHIDEVDIVSLAEQGLVEESDITFVNVDAVSTDGAADNNMFESEIDF